MAAAALDQHKKRLLSMRKELLDELSEGIKEGADDLKKEIGDIYDLASSERERELSLLLGHRDREKLVRIDEALSRISDGTYGVCDECGEKIKAERLKVMPFARLCVRCKEELERTTMTGIDLDGTRGGYRDVQISDVEEDD